MRNGFGCHSACNIGSDSNLMQFEIRVVLFREESAPFDNHCDAPVWCRPGLLWKVGSARRTEPLSPSGPREVLVCVPHAERLPDACIAITSAA